MAGRTCRMTGTIIPYKHADYVRMKSQHGNDIRLSGICNGEEEQGLGNDGGELSVCSN
jgi:hypothetical protein